MNRIKHKITVVLALFGVVFIAPVALAQIAPAGNDARIEIITRPPTIAALEPLEFGQIFRPVSGSPDYGLTCGATGTATLVDATPPIVASGVDTRQCGEVTLTAGDAPLTGYTLNFGASTTDLAGGSGGTPLAATYLLYDSSGGIVITAFEADGTNPSAPSDPVTTTTAAGGIAEFYVGGSVEVPTATSTAQVYSGTYEVVLTLP